MSRAEADSSRETETAGAVALETLA